MALAILLESPVLAGTNAWSLSEKKDYINNGRVGIARLQGDNAALLLSCSSESRNQTVQPQIHLQSLAKIPTIVRYQVDDLPALIGPWRNIMMDNTSTIFVFGPEAYAFVRSIQTGKTLVVKVGDGPDATLSSFDISNVSQGFAQLRTICPSLKTE